MLIIILLDLSKGKCHIKFAKKLGYMYMYKVVFILQIWNTKITSFQKSPNKTKTQRTRYD